MEKTNGEEVFFTIFFLFLSTLLFLPTSECGRAQAMFIFGDSLIDNGNNNFIPTIAKANYLPYGIDYGYPTGRFCNGLTVTDYGGFFPSPSISFTLIQFLAGTLYSLFIYCSEAIRAPISSAILELTVKDS